MAFAQPASFFGFPLHVEGLKSGSIGDPCSNRCIDHCQRSLAQIRFPELPLAVRGVARSAAVGHARFLNQDRFARYGRKRLGALSYPNGASGWVRSLQINGWVDVGREEVAKAPQFRQTILADRLGSRHRDRDLGRQER